MIISGLVGRLALHRLNAGLYANLCRLVHRLYAGLYANLGGLVNRLYAGLYANLGGLVNRLYTGSYAGFTQTLPFTFHFVVGGV